jgi:hypothetical protein
MDETCNAEIFATTPTPHLKMIKGADHEKEDEDGGGKKGVSNSDIKASQSKNVVDF